MLSFDNYRRAASIDAYGNNMTIFFIVEAIFPIMFIIIISVIITSVSKNIRRNTAAYRNQQYQNGNYNGQYNSKAPHGTGRPNKYKTINSHYSQATLQGKTNDDHNHAYEHKVEPIEEATVHELFEDRKEAYRERKAQMKAELPKTSYSEDASNNKILKSENYTGMSRNTAKNGDNGYMPNRSEKAIKCSYCSAMNIVPWNAKEKYSCYFCREEL